MSGLQSDEGAETTTVQLAPAATDPPALQVPPLIAAAMVLPLAPNCRLIPVTVCAVEFGLVKVQVLVDGPETVKTTEDAALTVRLALPEAELPAALTAVTLQLAVPLVVVPTLMLPLVPDPVAVAPAPEQLTLADVALLVLQLKVLLPPAVTLVGLKLAPVTLGGSTTLTLAWLVVEPPAPDAVTVQVPVPALEPAVAVMLPDVADPLPDPVTAPLQLADVLVALLALQLKVAAPPVVIVPTLKLDDAVGAAGAFTVRLALPDAEVPAALIAVTVQLPVPAALDPIGMLPLALTPLPPPDAGAEQDTLTVDALLVLQLSVLLPPTVTLVGLKLTLPTLGAATTLTFTELALPAVPTLLYGVTVHVPVPVLEVLTPRLELTCVPE